MKFNTIFPSFVAHDYLDIDNLAITKWCYEQYKCCPQPKLKGGWQSGPLEFSCLEKIQPLVEKLNLAIYDVRKLIGICDSVPHILSNFWININEPGNFLLDSNTPHIHPGYFLNCVYYPKGLPNSGNLYLLAPFNGVVQTIPVEHLSESTGWADTRWSVNPEPGKLVIFPSWLMHWVTPNYSEDDRISIAFNVSLPAVQVSTVGTVCVS